MQRLIQGDENEKKNEKEAKQIKNEFKFTNHNEQDIKTKLAQTEDLK